MIRHFLKTFLLFVIMILIGLAGVFLVNYFDNGVETAGNPNNQTGVAK